jgi:sigma-54 specific flagellar transcriptional regulator A
LCAYHWPGNVRELHNLIERMAVLHPHARVQAADLPPRYRATVGVANSAPALQPAPAWMPDPLTAAENAFVEAARPLNGSPAELSALPPEGVDLKDHIANIEISLIKQALLQANGVVAHAAKLLNTRRTTLVEKLRKYGLQREGLIDTEEVCF